MSCLLLGFHPRCCDGGNVQLWKNKKIFLIFSRFFRFFSFEFSLSWSSVGYRRTSGSSLARCARPPRGLGCNKWTHCNENLDPKPSFSWKMLEASFTLSYQLKTGVRMHIWMQMYAADILGAKLMFNDFPCQHAAYLKLSWEHTTQQEASTTILWSHTPKNQTNMHDIAFLNDTES